MDPLRQLPVPEASSLLSSATGKSRGVGSDDSPTENPKQDSEVFDPSELIHFKIGGQTFTTEKKHFKKHPESILCNLNESSPYYNKKENCYHFNKNPQFFNSVLKYCKNGVAHIPKGLCAKRVLQEMTFWGIELNCTSGCCRRYFLDKQEEADVLEPLLIKRSESQSSTEISRWREVGWKFLDGTSSKVWNKFYYAMIVLSVVVLFLGTHPKYRISLNIGNSTGNDVEGSVVSERIRALMATTPEETLWILEWVCLIFFTLELTIRAIVCPKLMDMVDICLVIDLLYLIPTWINVLTNWIHPTAWYVPNNAHVVNAYHFMQYVMGFRTFRLLTLGRYCRRTKALLLALKASWREVFLMVSVMVILGSMFAVSFHFAEFRIMKTVGINNAFIGLWLSLMTLTTIGYGDYHPTTWPGYIVAGVCAYVGIYSIRVFSSPASRRFKVLYRDLRLKIIDVSEYDDDELPESKDSDISVV